MNYLKIRNGRHLGHFFASLLIWHQKQRCESFNIFCSWGGGLEVSYEVMICFIIDMVWCVRWFGANSHLDKAIGSSLYNLYTVKNQEEDPTKWMFFASLLFDIRNNAVKALIFFIPEGGGAWGILCATYQTDELVSKT